MVLSLNLISELPSRLLTPVSASASVAIPVLYSAADQSPSKSHSRPAIRLLATAQMVSRFVSYVTGDLTTVRLKAVKNHQHAVRQTAISRKRQ